MVGFANRVRKKLFILGCPLFCMFALLYKGTAEHYHTQCVVNNHCQRKERLWLMIVLPVKSGYTRPALRKLFMSKGIHGLGRSRVNNG